MSAKHKRDSAILDNAATKVAANIEVQRKEALLKTGALQNAVLNSANFSIIATDEKGIIQLFCNALLWLGQPEATRPSA